MAEEDDEYFLPLQDQRVFGAGIRRKRVPFVPASSPENTISVQPPQAAPQQSAGDRYLSIVLKPKANTKDNAKDAVTASAETMESYAICPFCNEPLLPNPTQPESHESSIAHQLSLPHNQPPSHLPRSHVGLKYLASYGWDPDGREGLGLRAEGIRVPIKGKAKNDTVGLGVDLEEERRNIARHGSMKGGNEGVVQLNAKEVRKMHEEGKRRAEKLRQGFYGRDLEAYLGPGG